MKKLCLGILALASCSFAQTWNASSQVVPVANDTQTGTVANALAKLNASGQAVVTSTSDTSGILGIVSQNAGRTGYAGIVALGQASCAFDGATTAGDYVQASTTVAGSCHDAGSTFPSSGTVVGRVLSTNSLAGYYPVFVFPAEINGSAISQGGASYTLPPAGIGTLGGVSIGQYSGLDNSAGAISVKYGHSAYTALEGNDPTIANALQDPGANGLLKRTGQSTTAIASANDLPSGYQYSNLAGAPSLANQTAQVGGTSQVQRSKLNFVGGSNVSITPTDNGTDTTTLTIAATSPASVSSVSVGTIPSWLSGSFSNGTTTPTLNLGLASGQVSHQVLGTCGTATTFAPCALGVTDLPAGYAYSSLSGAPTLFDQLLQVNGASATQRAKVNFAAGTNVTLAAADNGTDTTTITINSAASGLTNFNTPVVPAWLTASVQNPTTVPTVTLAPAGSQTAHQVIGTCGTATSFAPCTLTVSDLPTGYPYTSVSGTPTLGTAAAQNTTAFDAAGTANAALTNAETYSSNASNLSSGTVAYARLPVGTSLNTVAAGNDGRFGNATSLNGTSIATFTGIPYLSGGAPSAATSSTVIGLFGSGACSGYLKSDGTCGTPTTNAGTVTQFEVPTVPTWLSAAVQSATTTPILTLSMASAQTSHQVIGTCGSSTTFGPCALTVGDLPSGYAYGSLSGTPTLGTAAAQPTSAFDAAGAATAAISTAEAFSANAANLISGSIPYARIPVGTTTGTVAAGNDARFGNATSLNGTSLSGFNGFTFFTSGTPASATASNVVGLFGSGSCSGYLKSDGTCGIPNATAGTVTNVATPSVPSWLNASVSNPTTVPAITIAPAASQLPHQVLGTCGLATSFAPCALVVADLPTGYAYSNLSGTPTLGTAASQNSTAFDAAGAATTAVTTAETYSSNASNLASGTIAFARLPVGTSANTVASGSDTRFGNATSLNGTSIANFAGLAMFNAGTPTSANASNIIALFGAGACSGYLKSDGTCGTPSAGGNGSVSIVNTPVVPSWMTATVANANSTPTITLAMAGSQLQHQVLGTCGSATAFAPCTLTASDLPSHSYSFGFAAQTTIVLAHNFGTQNVITQCFDANNTAITPGSIVITDNNDVSVTFLGSQTGRCVVLQ